MKVKLYIQKDDQELESLVAWYNFSTETVCYPKWLTDEHSLPTGYHPSTFKMVVLTVSKCLQNREIILRVED